MTKTDLLCHPLITLRAGFSPCLSVLSKVFEADLAEYVLHDLENKELTIQITKLTETYEYFKIKFQWKNKKRLVLTF